ncbi:hypothetical protein ACJ72_06212 [Emergomyces africanus]|uniref:F-box domain-containing protein n=1 Tax=Emergomyces africanus TaxID=1955775 RepID=A0A1B7NRP9_9EURO|nr:hypothetical protein ACJ72_06212 [Emergomyces africanus]
MSCHLLNLHAELQFLIFEQLQKCENPGKPDVQKNVKPRHRVQFHGEAMFERDLRNLSLTCGFYYESLIPYTFKNLVLQNSETSASSILRCTANTSRGYIRFTKELCFTDTRAMALAMEDDHPGDSSSDEDRKDDISMPELCQLPTSAVEILSNLSRFPNLERLLIHWRFPDSYWYIEQYAIEGDTEDGNGVVEREEQIPWRALMRDVYNAVSKNVVDINIASPSPGSSLSSPPQVPTLKSLEITNIPMNPVSTYFSPTFHNFLSSLRSFKLNLMTCDDIGNYGINTCFQYQMFAHKLDEYFFNHLSSATSLHISAWGAPLGSPDSGPAYSPLSLPQARGLPVLKRLVLEYCFITDPTLIGFLVAHARSLERVKFVKCFSDTDGNTWCKLFEALARARPERLVEFCVEPAKVKFKEPSWRINEENEREAARCQALLDGDGDEREGEWAVGEGGGVAGRRGRRAFRYGYIDDKYGFVSQVPENNREMFLRGEDQRAYDALMEIVERNKRRLMGVESGIFV